MNISCGVVRDLLPLYAEELTSEESKTLIEEHLESCPDCRGQLEALKTPPAPEPDGAAALRGVKKELRRKRMTAVLLAALLVFLPLFTLIARATERYPVPYTEGLLHAELGEDGMLAIEYLGGVAGVEKVTVKDPDNGQRSIFLQGWNNRLFDILGTQLSQCAEERINIAYYDRVIYGYGEEQTLLYGEPMNGGVQILPRLALTYYLLLAAAAAVVFGLLWLAFRKKKAAEDLRALFFGSLSYPIGHLLVKGTETLSFHLLRDLAFILIAAAAVWGLLMLGSAVLRRKKSEKA